VRFGITETVVEQDSSQEILEMLERSNLFIIPLDEERCWYRYHHLFADLLLQKLNQTQAGLESELHNRASKWYEQNKLMEEAVDHALAAKEFERAAKLIEGQIDAIWERGEHAKIFEWLNAIPEQKLSARPLISIYHTYVQLEGGKVEAAERSLKAVEQTILSINDETSSDNPQIGQLNTANLKSKAAVMRAMIAFRKADVPSILKFSRQALEDLPEKDLSWRGIAAMALGDAQYIVGDMNAANKALSEAIRISKTAGNIYIMAYTSIKLAIILQYQGKLDQALEICRELLTLMNASGLAQSALTGVLHAQWADILLDLDDIDNAFQFVTRGIELSEYEIDLTNLVWSHMVLVKVLYAKRDLTGAMETILKLENIAGVSQLPPWIVSRITAWKARIWLGEGNLVATNQWVQERQLNVDDEILFVREAEYIVLARILTLRGDLENAVDLLERLIVNAEAGGRITRLIEMLLVLALALKAQGESEQAMKSLSKGLSLAEAGGHTRLFVNEGSPMVNLLDEASSRGIRPDYVRHLMSAFPTDRAEKTDLSKTHVSHPELIEPLSEREIEVLQLIAEGLTNTEIAARLYLSLNTVKVHTRNIYGKLGVNNRTQAVARGRVVGILPSI
jgi:LuxR family maltose regulon positive regulatory protein